MHEKYPNDRRFMIGSPDRYKKLSENIPSAVTTWGWLVASTGLQHQSSDRIGRKPVFVAGSLGCAIMVFPYFLAISTGSSTLIFIAASLLSGVVYAATSAIWPSFFGEMFETRRALLVKIKRDLENQVRGLLKNLGLVVGHGTFNVFAVRAKELIADRPELTSAVSPLLTARTAIEQQIGELDRQVLKLSRQDAQARRFMTVPGIGPITALCFKATIDDPARFRRSRSVGAYIGLTTRRHASGELDWSGRISKCGDAMLRMYLFEAAGVLLTRVPKWSALKAWGTRLTKRNGLRKAKVAVARKLAVILHRMWVDGTEFNWSNNNKEVAA